MSDSVNEIELRDEQGRLTGRFRMAEGKLHGRSILYGIDGVIAEICYAHGLRHGEMRSYGDNGQLSSIVPHVADRPAGEARYFHPDGSLARRANYRAGKLHGEVDDYAPDGKLISHTSYVEGKKQAEAAGPDGAAAAGAEAAPRKNWLARIVEG